MRFFLTDPVPGLAEALLAAGHAVVSTPPEQVPAFLGDLDHPQDYPLGRLLADTAADVAILVDPVRALPGGVQFGFMRSQVNRWRGRNHTVVFLALSDPGVWDAYRTHCARGCIARVQDAAVYASVDPCAVAAAGRTMRAVLWRPDATPALLAAIEHARSGRAYSPAKDAGRW